MSSVIDIVFDHEVTGYALADRYSLVCVYFEAEFEEVAKRLGLVPLTAFYSEDPNSLDNWFDGDFFDDPAELKRLKQKMGSDLSSGRTSAEESNDEVNLTRRRRWLKVLAC